MGTTSITSKGYFVSSIVYAHEGLFQVSEISQLLMIDGQELFATITPLMAALRSPWQVGEIGLPRRSKWAEAEARRLTPGTALRDV